MSENDLGQEYLSALGELRQAIVREQNRIQVGESPGYDLAEAWSKVASIRMRLALQPIAAAFEQFGKSIRDIVEKGKRP